MPKTLSMGMLTPKPHPLPPLAFSCVVALKHVSELITRLFLCFQVTSGTSQTFTSTLSSTKKVSPKHTPIDTQTTPNFTFQSNSLCALSFISALCLCNNTKHTARTTSFHLMCVCVYIGCWKPEYEGHSGSRLQRRYSGLYGDYGCDSPWKLVESAINAMKTRQDVDFLLWTG